MAVVTAAHTRVESRPKAEGKSLLSRRASVHLDVIRAVSALAVAIGHVRGLFFVEYLELPHRGAFFALLYGVTGLGRPAVMVSTIVVAYAYLIASFTEARTEAARSKVLLLLPHRRKGAVL